MAFTARRGGGGLGPAGARMPALKALGDQGVAGELNITPMIDVMLALLIIFMVVTPVLSEYSAEPPAGGPRDSRRRCGTRSPSVSTHGAPTSWGRTAFRPRI